MAKAKSSSSAGKKIVDIKQEGDAATGTSRPIIVTNRPIMKDPMMAEVSQLTESAVKPPVEVKEPAPAPEVDEPMSQAAKPATPPSKKKLVIKPLSEADDAESEPVAGSAPDEKASATKPAAENEVVSPPAKPKSSNEADAGQIPTNDDDDDEAKPAKEAPTTPDIRPESTTAVQPGRSFDDDQVKTGSVDDGGEQQASAGKDAKAVLVDGLTPDQQKAVEEGAYFLPITTAETRRLRRDISLAVVILLVLLAVWANIMLDAEMIELGNVKALTDFF